MHPEPEDERGSARSPEPNHSGAKSSNARTAYWSGVQTSAGRLRDEDAIGVRQVSCRCDQRRNLVVSQSPPPSRRPRRSRRTRPSPAESGWASGATRGARGSPRFARRHASTPKRLPAGPHATAIMITGVIFVTVNVDSGSASATNAQMAREDQRGRAGPEAGGDHEGRDDHRGHDEPRDRRRQARDVERLGDVPLEARNDEARVANPLVGVDQPPREEAERGERREHTDDLRAAPRASARRSTRSPPGTGGGEEPSAWRSRRGSSAGPCPRGWPTVAPAPGRQSRRTGACASSGCRRATRGRYLFTGPPGLGMGSRTMLRRTPPMGRSCGTPSLSHA